MPVPADAPSADCSISDATDASTEELHTSDCEEPGGTTKDTTAESTTVVGGTADSDGVADGVREGDTLEDTETLLDTDTDGAIDGDATADVDADALMLTDALDVADEVIVALNDGDAAADVDADALMLADTLTALIEALTLDVREPLGDAERDADALTDGLLEKHCWPPSPHAELTLGGGRKTKYCGDELVDTASATVTGVNDRDVSAEMALTTATRSPDCGMYVVVL